MSKYLEKTLIAYGMAIINLRLATARIRYAKINGDTKARSVFKNAESSECLWRDEMKSLLERSKEETQAAMDWMEMYASQYMEEGNTEAKGFKEWMKGQWKEA